MDRGAWQATVHGGAKSQTQLSTAHQAPPSLVFSRQEHWSELPSPSPGDLPDPGIEPEYLSFQVDSLPSEPPESEEELKSLLMKV